MKKRPEFNKKAKELVLEKMALDISNQQKTNYDDVLKILNEEVLGDEEIWDFQKNEIKSSANEIEEEIDEKVVDIFSSIWLYKKDVMDTLTEEWVVENNIVPTLSIGDKVMVPHNENSYVGEIVDFMGKHGQYLVSIEALGHKEENSMVKGVLVNYEDAKPVTESFETKS